MKATHQETPVVIGSARQQRLVLAALLSRAGRPTSADWLITALWADRPPPTARRNVQVLVYQLRRALGGDQILGRSDGYMIPASASLDSQRFRELTARGSAALERGETTEGGRLLRLALDLWRGPAFTEFADCEPVAAEAASLEELRVTAYERWAQAELAVGHHAAVVDELGDLVRAHPYREALAAQLMRGLTLSGSKGKALEVFETTRQMLREHLGVDPGPVLRRLHEEILRDEVEASPRRTFLPCDVPDFTGRAADIERVLAVLRGGAPAVIDGMAGIGKSCLAVHVAHTLALAFGDGQLYCDLHGFTPGRDPLSAEAALATLLVQLGVPASQLPDDLDQRAALWRAETSGRRLMVLLDNAAGTEQVQPLMPGTSSVGVLVTSRRRLPGLDGAVSVPLEVLSTPDAQTLFAAIAGRDDAGIVALCGYLPLAIRIAAARLAHRPHWTAAHLAELLGAEQHRLAELRVAGRDVAAAFALSYADLTPAQKRMFRLLGVHPGADFGVLAAAALAGLGEAEACGLLEELLNAHLLGQHAPGRYRMHGLLAEHARDTVRAAESGPALRRLLDFYRDGTGDVWHAAERGNLRVITEHAEALQHDEHAWQIADHTATYLRERGHRDDHVAVAEAGTRAARRLGDASAIQTSLGHLTTAYWATGRLDDALTTATQRLKVACDGGDRAAHTSALAMLGVLHLMFGHFAEAITIHRQALDLIDETGNRVQAGPVWCNLSSVQDMVGQADDALASALQSEQVRQEVGDLRGLIQTRAHLALVLARLGRHPEALDIGAGAVRAAIEAEHPYGEAWSRIDFADVLLLSGRPEEAHEHAERAGAILWQLNYPLLLTMAANTLGTACRALDRPVAALTHHRLARDTAARVGYRPQEARALEGLGHSHAALADHTAARRAWQKAHDHYAAMGMPQADALHLRLGTG